jgi:hypothetical protein
MYLSSPVRDLDKRLGGYFWCRCINVSIAGPGFAYQEDSGLHFAYRFADEITMSDPFEHSKAVFDSWVIL